MQTSFYYLVLMAKVKGLPPEGNVETKRIHIYLGGGKIRLYYEKILHNEAFHVYFSLILSHVTNKMWFGVRLGSQTEKCSMKFESQSVLLLDIVL